MLTVPKTPAFADHCATVCSVQQHPWPYFTATLRVPEAFGVALAGQFLMTVAEFGLEPYLRRAFSIFDQRRVARSIRVGSEGSAAGSDEAGEDGGVSGWEIDIFAKVVGLGTTGLASLAAGQRIPVLGPLGRGFRLLPVEAPRRIGLVAGGIGSAALFLWGKELADRGLPFDFLYGGYSAVDLSLRERFAELAERSGGTLICATETGEAGHHGYITEPLERGLSEGRYGALYSCGPHGLMARVASLGREYSVAGQAALETEMGCGFGACLGCAVERQDGTYSLCCKDGPVFDMQEISW